ncbi:MAG: sulfatase [bacterium]|nr:sulfatase [bacterium]
MSDFAIKNCWLAALLVVFSVFPAGVIVAEDERPNIVMIVVDDLRFDEFGAGGHTYLETPHIDSLAREGALFEQAYHSTPLCSPNRASILTGQYVSRHGILDNTSRAFASHLLDLFPKELQKAGYYTAHIGKWHMGNDPTPRPGYDYWSSFSGQGNTFDPVLYENGKENQVKGYITDIFTDRAVSVIEKSGDQPFFIYIGHKAVHPEAIQRDDGTVDLSVPREFMPAKRHKGKYSDKVFKRRPNYGLSAENAAGKPVINKALEIRQELERSPEWAHEIDAGVAEDTIRARAEMMLAVDEGVGRIIKTLKENGKLDDTLIIFTSDNGYFFGEHGLSIERRLPYEESVRTPLVMRFPKLVQEESRISSPVVSVDLAATVLDIAGVKIPDHVQGKSLVPVLVQPNTSVHESFLIEYYSHENPFPWTANLDYRIVRKGKFKYIRWIRFEDQAELYDLEADPYELENLVKNPTKAAVVEDMKAEMRKLVLASLGLSN